MAVFCVCLGFVVVVRFGNYNIPYYVSFSHVLSRLRGQMAIPIGNNDWWNNHFVKEIDRQNELLVGQRARKKPNATKMDSSIRDTQMTQMKWQYIIIVVHSALKSVEYQPKWCKPNSIEIIIKFTFIQIDKVYTMNLIHSPDTLSFNQQAIVVIVVVVVVSHTLSKLFLFFLFSTL